MLRLLEISGDPEATLSIFQTSVDCGLDDARQLIYRVSGSLAHSLAGIKIRHLQEQYFPPPLAGLGEAAMNALHRCLERCLVPSPGSSNSEKFF